MLSSCKIWAFVSTLNILYHYISALVCLHCLPFISLRSRFYFSRIVIIMKLYFPHNPIFHYFSLIKSPPCLHSPPESVVIVGKIVTVDYFLLHIITGTLSTSSVRNEHLPSWPRSERY